MAPIREPGISPRTVVFVGGHRGTHLVCVGARYIRPGAHRAVTVPPTARDTPPVRFIHP